MNNYVCNKEKIINGKKIMKERIFDRYRYQMPEDLRAEISKYARELYIDLLVKNRDQKQEKILEFYSHNLIFVLYSMLIGGSKHTKDYIFGLADVKKDDILSFVKNEFSNWYNAVTTKNEDDIDLIVVNDSKEGMSSLITGYNKNGMGLKGNNTILEAILFSENIAEILTIIYYLYVRLKKVINNQDFKVYCGGFYHLI